MVFRHFGTVIRMYVCLAFAAIAVNDYKIFRTWHQIGLSFITIVCNLAVAPYTSSRNPLVEILSSIIWTGCLAVTSGYISYHTQKMIGSAEATPIDAPFDPINW